MATDQQIYRFLKFKAHFIRGTKLCRAMKIPHMRLKALDNVNGIGSFGPCTRRPLSPIRYAKCNAFSADFIAFFRLGEKYHCIKGRQIMRGRRNPRSKRYRCED